MEQQVFESSTSISGDEPWVVQSAHSSPQAPSLSVLVRCFNEAKALPEFWKRLKSQTVFSLLEVIVLDSGSTDGSLEILRQQPCRIYQIASATFNFGRSCNQLMKLARSPLVLFLSAHVLLDQDDSIAKLIASLDVGEVQAAYLRQVPNPIFGFTAYEAAFLKRRFPDGEYPISMQEAGGFSNAASALTRAAWSRTPFPELHGSEDFCWIQMHLQAGYKLFYLPYIRVMHSHNETPSELYRRVRLNAIARGQTKRYEKAIYTFFGVLVETFRAGASAKEAVRFAWAHASAYAWERSTR